MRGGFGSAPPRAALVVVVVLLASWPALDNGFIEDDYVLLERASSLAADPASLFHIPPEGFRLSTYLSFLGLEGIFGYRTQAFYAFVILLHLLNVWLLYRLVAGITGRPSVALLCVLLFVSFQDPQEAIMWLSAMNELWLGFFLLSALLLWRNGRLLASSLCYCGALLSKESAPMVFFLVMAVGLLEKRPFRVRPLLVLIIPTLPALLALVATAPSNSLIQAGYYAFTFKALWVWLRSLLRLAFPWVFVALAISLARGRWPARSSGALFLWIGGALLPYCFLTYQEHIPSRQLYVASMGVAFLLALLLAGWRSPFLVGLFLGFFALGNLSYLWVVKDAQYERRAAPTSELLKVLENRRPECLAIRNFPGNPWTGKLTARLVPGWKPELLQVGAVAAACLPEATLRWNTERRVYQEWSGQDEGGSESSRP